MNKRNSDSAWIVICAIAIACFVFAVKPAGAIMVIEDDEGKRYFAFTPQEVEAITKTMKGLKEENEALKAKIAKGSCV